MTMIKLFYNLKTLPFQKDINPGDIFLSTASKELFQRLEYIKQNRGIMMITGMPGTGKTLHLRSFVQKLNPIHQSFNQRITLKFHLTALSKEETQHYYGVYLRINFTIVEGELKDWSFYGIVKPNSFKQSKFYRWMIKLVGNEPAPDSCVNQLLGIECRILLQKRCKEDKTYYSVADLV